MILNTFWNPLTSMGVHTYSICRPVCRPALHHLFHLWTLRTGPSGDRTPVGAWFSAPTRTGPAGHPSFYKWVSGHSHALTCQVVALTTHLQLALSLNKRRAVNSPSVPSWQIIGRNLLSFTFYYLCERIICFLFYILHLYLFSKDSLAVFMILSCNLATR